MQVVNLEQKLFLFSEYYKPRTVDEFNRHDLMVVKVKGPFNWHKHDETDDFFLVLKGKLTIQLKDRSVELHLGEMFVVPKGVEHCPSLCPVPRFRERYGDGECADSHILSRR